MFVHGISVGTCSARGKVSLSRSGSDFDGVMCLQFFFLPVLPLKAVHVWNADGGGEAQKTWPIRWSLGLLVRAYLRRWLWLLLGFALLMVVTALGPRGSRGAAVVCVGAAAVVSLVMWFLYRADTRDQEIRLLLGRHVGGSSDPLHWRPDRLADPPDARAVYGSATFADAVRPLLAAREYSRAMWAARLCAAVEDSRTGEDLTDEVRQDPGAREAMAAVRLNPYTWQRVMVPE